MSSAGNDGVERPPYRSNRVQEWLTIDACLSEAVSNGAITGAAAAVVTADDVVHVSSAGTTVAGGLERFSPDSVVWLASMTKPVVAVAAMQLVERRLLSLDERLDELMPELSGLRVLSGWSADGSPMFMRRTSNITLRRLLNHTAGFGHDFWNADAARYLQVQKIPRTGTGRRNSLRMPLVTQPGTRWEYGIGMDWVGLIIERVSNTSLADYVNANVTGPLGMGSTGFTLTTEQRTRMCKVHRRDSSGTLVPTDFEVNEERDFAPAGSGMYSTCRDFCRFMRMLLNKGKLDGIQILSEGSVTVMTSWAASDPVMGRLPSHAPELTHDLDLLPDVEKRWGLLGMMNAADVIGRRRAGAVGWSGLANTTFWIDPAAGFGGTFMAQSLPFLDARVKSVSEEFEFAAYAAMNRRK